MKTRRKTANIWYTIYAAHSDELLAYGSPVTCARMMGIPVGDIYSLVSRTRSGRTKCYTIVWEDLDAHTCKIFGEGNHGKQYKTNRRKPSAPGERRDSYDLHRD